MAVQERRRLAVALLGIALDRRQIQRLLGEFAFASERDRKQRRHRLATVLRVGRIGKYGGAVKTCVSGVTAFRIDFHAPGEPHRVFELRSEMVERGGADGFFDPVRIQRFQFQFTFGFGSGQRPHQPRAVDVPRGRELLHEPPVASARL